MTDLRLYTQHFNPFAEKVARALALKKLDFVRVPCNDTEEIARLSPATRMLPVLEIEGQRLCESNVIIAHLETRFPQPPLVAAEPKVAEAQRSLAAWSDSSFLFYWNRWLAAQRTLPGDDVPPEADAAQSLLRGLGRTLRRVFSATPDAVSRVRLREIEIAAGMAQRLDDLVGFLGSRPYFHADVPSIADLSIFAMLEILKEGPMTAGPELIAERPTLVAYMSRLDQAAALPPAGARQPVD